MKRSNAMCHLAWGAAVLLAATPAAADVVVRGNLSWPGFAAGAAAVRITGESSTNFAGFVTREALVSLNGPNSGTYQVTFAESDGVDKFFLSASVVTCGPDSFSHPYGFSIDLPSCGSYSAFFGSPDRGFAPPGAWLSFDAGTSYAYGAPEMTVQYDVALPADVTFGTLEGRVSLPDLLVAGGATLVQTAYAFNIRMQAIAALAPGGAWSAPLVAAPGVEQTIVSPFEVRVTGRENFSMSQSTQQTITSPGQIATFDLPSFTHLHGSFVWPGFPAGSAKVWVAGNRGGDSASVHLNPGGSSGAYDLIAWPDDTGMLGGQLATCTELAPCANSLDRPGTSVLLFSVGSFDSTGQAGRTLTIDLSTPAGFGTRQVCGRVASNQSQVIGGSMFLFGSDASSSGTAVSTLDPNGDYCALATPGFWQASANADVEGCGIPVGGHAEFEVVPGAETLREDISFDINLYPPGAVAGVASLTGFPDNAVYMVFGHDAQPPLNNCLGGVSSFFVNRTGPGPVAVANLLPGDYQLPFRHVEAYMENGPDISSYQYDFARDPIATITVNSGQTATVDLEFASPAALVGAAPPGETPAAFISLIVNASSTAGAQFGFRRNQTGPVPFEFELPLDAAETWNAMDVLYYRAEEFTSSNSGLSAQASFPLSGIMPGPQPLPGRLRDLLGGPLARWTVRVPPPPVHGSSNWSGSATAPDGQLSANAQPSSGATAFEARLLAGSYQGQYATFDYDTLSQSETPLSVEVAATDVVTQDLSGPLISGVMPQPGTTCGPSLHVTGDVTDPDGVLSVSLNGVEQAGRALNGNVVPQVGTNPISILARDRLHKQTLLQRTFTRPMQANGPLAPLAAFAPAGTPAGSIPVPPKAFKPNTTARIQFTISSCGGLVKDPAAFAGAPELVEVTLAGAAIPLESIDTRVDDADEEGIPFKLGSDGVWTYNLKLKFGTGTFVGTILMPDGSRSLFLFVVKP